MQFNEEIQPIKIKADNTKKLRSTGIDVIDHLPFLENPDFRDQEKIARRMMVLLGLFQLHLRAPNQIIQNWFEENGLMSELTVEELEYLERKYSDLPKQNQIDIYWFVEAIWTFAWIGGLHDNLTLNTGVENSLVNLIPNIQKNESATEFISHFRMRSQYEIFAMLDKFYRAHWFARNNHLTGKTSEKVDLDIILERRKALEYTVYKQYQWDDMPLHT